MSFLWDLLKLFSSVIIALFVGLFGLLGGCSANKENWDVTKSQLNQAIVMMKETRTAGTFSIFWGGKPSIGVVNAVFVDSGVTAQLNGQINATEGDAVTGGP